MARTDLLALTPESIAALATMGDVKRATREISEGKGPSLEEAKDGTVTGTFPDGIVTKLVPNKSLKDASSTCKCVTNKPCRHRVAVALAYREFYEAQVTKSRRVAGIDLTWTPGEFDDETMEKSVGKKTMERARAVFRAGIVVTVVPPSPEDPVCTAKLPACTVRFLVPRDIGYTQCDCEAKSRGTSCEHIVLAAWAFREAGKIASEKTIALGKAQRPDADAHAALAEAEALTSLLLRTGVANVTASMQQRFAKVRSSLEDEGLVWPMDAIDDIERMLDAYAARSARYSTQKLALFLTEIAARARAARVGGELPSRFILGEDEVKETLLDHARLVSLGARVEADGLFRSVEVFLVDPDTAGVLVLRKDWKLDEKDKPQDGPMLAQRSVAKGVQLGSLAHGQMVSKAVKRKANREIILASSRTSLKTSGVTPQRGEWGELPVPLLVTSLAELALHMRGAPPRFLRPRVLCEGMHVLAVKNVGEMGYATAQQELWAVVFDKDDAPLRLRKKHKAVAPLALDATAAALKKGVKFIAGEIELDHGGLVMEPVGIVTEDGVVVPDLAPSAPKLDAPQAIAQAHPDPIREALANAISALEEGLHSGLDRAGTEWIARVRQAAEIANAVGLEGIASRLKRLAETAGKESAPLAWLDAAIRTSLTREMVT